MATISRSGIALLSLILITTRLYPNDLGGEVTNERIVLEKGVVHEGWFFAAGEMVIIDGTVNGDTYAAGGTIEVNGIINGDLIVAGGNITINGAVSDDIRVAGGNIILNGTVGKDVTAAGGNIAVGRDATIKGNLLSAGGNLNVDGAVGREIKAGAGRMVVGGSVGDDVSFAGGSFTVLSGAAIHGNVELMVGKEKDVDIADGAVDGVVTIRGRNEEEVCDDIIGFKPVHFWFKIIWFVSLLFTGLILTFLLPKQLNRAGSFIADHAGETALWGFIGFVGVPVIAIVLFMTIIGLPLGLFLTALYLWWLYLSQLILGVAVGRRLFGTVDRTGWGLYAAVASGTCIIQALTFVPYLRYLVIAIAVLFGIGAILRVIRDEYLRR